MSEDHEDYDVRVGEPLSAELWRAEMERELTRMQQWFDHPQMKALREERDRLWRETPWYKKARVRISLKIEDWRTRLGEIIAGRRFE